MDINQFKHKTAVTVRFHEVDMLGVCNNAVYINYFEHARLQYIKDLGLIPEGGIFSDGMLFFMVRNEVDYKSFARFDDKLNIYSRVTFIKNSSFGYDHIVENARTGVVIAEGSGVIAQVDPRTRKSTPLQDHFIKAVTEYEKDVKILR